MARSNYTNKIAELKAFHEFLIRHVKSDEEARFSFIQTMSATQPLMTDKALDISIQISEITNVYANNIFIVLLWSLWEGFAHDTTIPKVSKFIHYQGQVWYKKLGGNLSSINELRLLRNSIVHNDGLISKDYIATFPSNGYFFNDKILIDDIAITNYLSIVENRIQRLI